MDYVIDAFAIGFVRMLYAMCAPSVSLAVSLSLSRSLRMYKMHICIIAAK